MQPWVQLLDRQALEGLLFSLTAFPASVMRPPTSEAPARFPFKGTDLPKTAAFPVSVPISQLASLLGACPEGLPLGDVQTQNFTLCPQIQADG